jgi:hypothetical protein
MHDAALTVLPITLWINAKKKSVGTNLRKIE